MLTDYTFLVTDSVIFISWNISRFRSSNWSLKNLSFLRTVFVFEKTWKNSNFQCSNILLRNFILFANQFRVWYNLNCLRFRAWLAWLKNSTLPRTESFYEKTCYISIFQSSKSWLKKLHFFANWFGHLYNFKNLKDFVLKLIAETSQLFRKPYPYLKKIERNQTFKDRITCLKNLFFLRTNSAYDIAWTI